MIDKVSSGQKITASGYNNLIDNINSLNLLTQTSIDQVRMAKKSQIGGYSTLFQVREADSFKLTNRPNTYDEKTIEKNIKFILLGKNVEKITKTLGVDKVYLFTGDSATEGELKDEWLKVNGEGYFYDGWLNTTFDRSKDIYGAIIGLVPEEGKITPASIEKKFLCIASEEDAESIKGQLEKYEQPEEKKKFEALGTFPIACYTEPGMIKGASGSSGSDFKQLVQYFTGSSLPISIDYSFEVKLDSQCENKINKKNQKSVMYLSSDLSTDVENYIELNNFSLDSTTTKNKLYDKEAQADVVVRVRTNDDRYVDYLSLSDVTGGAGRTDTDESDAGTLNPQQYSIEHKVDETLSIDCLQLRKFDNPNIEQYEDIKDGQFLIRNDKNGQINLVYSNINDLLSNALSGIDIGIKTDTDESNGGKLQPIQYSIERKQSDDVSTDYLQLYNFDEATKEKASEVKNGEFLIRKFTADNISLTYIKIEDLLSDALPNISGVFEKIYADSNIAELKQHSLNKYTDLSSGRVYFQLNNFNGTKSAKYDDLSATGQILIKDIKNDEKILKYLDLSALPQISTEVYTDADTTSVTPGIEDQQSISYNYDLIPEKPFLQLYNFDNNTFGTRTMEEARNWNSTVLLRSVDNNNPFLTYVNLSDFITDVPVDSTMAPTLHQYSIEWNSINEETGPFLQLNHFDMDTFSTNTIEEAKEYNSTILMRAVVDNHPELIYVDLSSLSSNSEIISGDSDVLVDSYKSIKLVENSDKKKYYQLYDFDKPEAAPLSTYPEVDKIHWVCRYNDNSLVYVDAQESLKSYEPIKTDSTYNIGYSLETKYEPAFEKYYHQICNFDNSSMNFSWKIEPSTYDIDNWMNEGSTTMPFYSDTPGGPEPYEFDSIGRWNNQVIYTKLNSVHCMPFIHGDADSYVNNGYYSIEHVYDGTDQTKTYYQLYGFKDGGSFDYTANILSSATSLTPDKDNKDYDFVLRDNKTGKISYAKLKATAQVDLTEINNKITNLGDNINTNTTNIYNLSGVVINLSGDINDLSNQISGLTGNYWVTDGEQNTNNCKTGQIDILTCYVIDGGQLTCNANIHMNDYNLDLGYSGTLYVSNIDSLTSYINIQKGINVWQDSSFSGGLTCNSLQVNSATHFGTLTADNLYSTSFKSNMIECETTCYVNTLMSENNIMIGGTTLSEAQLKKLLALIN